MCNRYVSPAVSDIERLWSVGGRNAPGLAGSGSSASAAPDWRKTEVFPRAQGAFIRRHSEEVTPAGGRELIVGQWGLIPWFAKTPKLTLSKTKARSEELAAKATFEHPWARGHAPEFGGHDAETVGHAPPKYATKSRTVTECV